MRMHHPIGWLAAAGAIMLASPALADVKAGVDAWSGGDYALAVKEWQGAAEKGDADAQFNLAQAYRLGRGIPQDNDKAIALYKSAAAAGHPQAADHYGLMLFQSGDRQAALPYVEAAAGRGDPRAQYLLGIARFNGDLLAKDWVQAYALLTMANASGLPQAVPALAQMDEFIPLEQRQKGAGLAAKMQKEADARRAAQLAAAELGGGAGAASAQVSESTPKVPARIEQVEAAPSSSAIAEVMRATGTENPAGAGADYARPRSRQPAVAMAGPGTVASAPAPESPAPAPVSAPTPRQMVAGTADGPWRLQLGAFSVAGNAERLWTQLSGKPELAGKVRITEPAGKLTKLLAGGYRTKAEADEACAALKRGGQGCLVTR